MRPWVLCYGSFALGCAAACTHDDGMNAGTATIHGGTPEGPRVTSLPLGSSGAAPASGLRAEMGDRLARAYCRHARACARSDEGADPTRRHEEACFVDSRRALRASIDQWPCDPAGTEVGLDECLAAIRDADCSARGGVHAQIPACRASEICRRGNVGGR